MSEVKYVGLEAAEALIQETQNRLNDKSPINHSHNLSSTSAGLYAFAMSLIILIKSQTDKDFQECKSVKHLSLYGLAAYFWRKMSQGLSMVSEEVLQAGLYCFAGLVFGDFAYFVLILLWESIYSS